MDDYRNLFFLVKYKVLCYIDFYNKLFKEGIECFFYEGICFKNK